MKRIFLILSLSILLSNISLGQLRQISVAGDFTLPLGERLAITGNSALGAIISAKFDVGSDICLTLNTGYQQYSFSQDSSLAQWDWRYWDYYYQFVQTTLTEEEYSAVLSPFQKMDVIPLYFTIDYRAQMSEKFSLSPSIGAGVLFFTRRFYVTEDWARDFEQIDYRFSYSFRNIGPEKGGNPLFALIGISGEYEFTEDYYLVGSVNYKQVFDTGDKFGFDLFTFNNSLSFNLGIGFGY